MNCDNNLPKEFNNIKGKPNLYDTENMNINSKEDDLDNILSSGTWISQNKGKPYKFENEEYNDNQKGRGQKESWED